VSLLALRHDLEAALPERGRPAFGEVLLPVTPGEQAIVEAAVLESDVVSPEYVGPHHLLLALLREPDGPIGRLFSRHGVTYESVLEHVRAAFASRP
jgi:hypothetical protein